MTQDKIDSLTTAYKLLDNLRATYEMTEKHIRTVIVAQAKDCDHENADGTTAVVSGMVWGTCSICRRDDLL